MSEVSWESVLKEWREVVAGEERKRNENEQRRVVPLEGVVMDTDKDVYHTFKATVGVKAIRDNKGIIKRVSSAGIWQNRPDYVDIDVRLVRVEIEVPESFFGFEAKAKGKIESKLTEEFTALVEELG